jgi:hypothetical protein
MKISVMTIQNQRLKFKKFKVCTSNLALKSSKRFWEFLNFCLLITTDELVSLNAQLKQITLQRREALNNYLDLKGLSFVPEFSVCENSFIFGFVSFNKDNRCHYMLIDMSLSHRKYKGVLPYKAFSS